MFTEQFVETLLVAGVTGAGLVLTAFTIGVLKAEELLKYRAGTLKREIEELNKTKVTAATSIPKLRQLQRQLESIEGKQRLPTYLGILIYVTFILFISVSLGAVWSLTQQSSPSRDAIDAELPLLFAGSCFFFLLTGISLIRDILSTTRMRYKELTQSASDSLET